MSKLNITIPEDQLKETAVMPPVDAPVNTGEPVVSVAPTTPAGEVTPPTAPIVQAQSSTVPETAPIVTPPKMYKLKVNGREIEATEDQVVEYAQKVQAANEQFQEASKIKKEMARVMERFVEDPLTVAQELGRDPEEYVREFIRRKAEEEQMTPEERRIKELEAEKGQRLTRVQELEQEKAQAEYQVKYQEALQKWSTEIKGALEKATDLPKNPAVAKAVVQKIKEFRASGYNVTAEQAVNLVRQDLEEFKKATGIDPNGTNPLTGKQNLPPSMGPNGATVGKTSEPKVLEPVTKEAPKRLTTQEWREAIREAASK